MSAGPVTSSATPTSSTTFPNNIGTLTPQTTYNTAGNNTITAANMISSIYNRDCNGADRTDTTDTATLIVAGLNSPTTNSAFTFYVKNVGTANDVTVAGGSSVTVTGCAVVGVGLTGEFRGVVTNVATPAVTLYRVSSTS